MFSGQEPIAKFSGDVNSKALPVFKSARDARGCQDDIKQNKKKMEGRWRCGEVTHDRCHGHVFHPPYFFSNWPSPQEQRLLTNHKKEKEGERLESESFSPNTTIHRPGRQAFNTITTHAIVACSSGMAQISSKPPPSPPGLALPPGFFVRATPVIYSLNDKTQTSTHSSLESEDNHITAEDRDANQRWARTQTWICINPNSTVSSSTARLLFFHRGAKKYTQLWNAEYG